MINLNLLIPALITTSLAIAGWYIGHLQNIKRDQANKRRDLRVQYLIEAYRRIERAANRSKDFDNNLELESAIADIQLFGTAHQVHLAENFAFGIANNTNTSVNELLVNLRADLRQELKLEAISPEITFLRLDKNK